MFSEWVLWCLTEFMYDCSSFTRIKPERKCFSCYWSMFWGDKTSTLLDIVRKGRKKVVFSQVQRWLTEFMCDCWTFRPTLTRPERKRCLSYWPVFQGDGASALLDMVRETRIKVDFSIQWCLIEFFVWLLKFYMDTTRIKEIKNVLHVIGQCLREIKLARSWTWS